MCDLVHLGQGFLLRSNAPEPTLASSLCDNKGKSSFDQPPRHDRDLFLYAFDLRIMRVDSRAIRSLGGPPNSPWAENA
jgi:hypothetical protein